MVHAMKKLIKTVVGVTLGLITLSVNAQDIIQKNIDPIDMFAVSKPVRDASERLISVIETDEITDASGELAKGPHSVIVEIDATSDVGAVINGQTINPGESASFEVDLSAVGHKLRLPVYPSIDNQIGNIKYAIRIPNVRVSLCPAGFTETPVDCYRIEYAEITYICPADFGYENVTQDCRQVEAVELVNECPVGYTHDKVNDTCFKEVATSTNKQCPAGYSQRDGACVKDAWYAPSACDTGFTLNDSGQCEKVVSSFAAVSPCPAASTYNASTNQCETKSSLVKDPLYTCPRGTVAIDTATSDGSTSPPSCHALSESNLIVNSPYYTRVTSDYRAAWQMDAAYYQVYTSAQWASRPASYFAMQERCPMGMIYGGVQDGLHVCVIQDVIPDTAIRKTPNACSGNYQFEIIDGRSECVSKEAQSPASSCPVYVGTNLVSRIESGQCAYYESVDSGYWCDGKRSAGAQCETYDYSASGNYCTNGGAYDSTEKVCVTTETVEITPICPSNYTLSPDGTQCLTTQTVALNISCPSTYTRSADGQYCYKEYSEPATQSCPTGSGWTKNGTSCDYFDSTDVQSCPSGYVLKSGSCHRVVDANQSCSSGYSNNGSGTCVKSESTAAAQSCPSGYTNNGSGTCVKNESTAATQSCPSGYVNNGSGTCTKFESQGATSCPSGYTLRSGNCHKTTAKLKSCPSGYTLSGGQCTRTLTASPTITESGTAMLNYESRVYNYTSTYGVRVKYTKGAAHVYIGGGGGGGCGGTGGATKLCFVQPPGEFNYAPQMDSNLEDIMGLRYIVSGPLATGYRHNCLIGETLSGYDCVKYNDASMSCASGYSLVHPSGYENSNSYCRKIETRAATTYCPSGYSSLNTSTCYQNTATNSVGYCASGFSLNTGNGNCERTLSTSVTYSCSSGWTLSGTRCNRTLTQPVTYSCSSGWSLSGASCNRTLTKPVVYSCNSGYTTHTATTCYSTSASMTVGACASGYSLNSSNGNCEKSLSQEVYYTCPTGAEWTLTKPNCDFYNEEPLIINCPDGFVAGEGTTCEKLRVEPAIFECPDLYSPDVNNDRCVRETRVPHLY